MQQQQERRNLTWGLTPQELKIWLKAYDAGINAAEASQSRNYNPYPDGSLPHRGWDRGWHIKFLMFGFKGDDNVCQ